MLIYILVSFVGYALAFLLGVRVGVRRNKRSASDGIPTLDVRVVRPRSTRSVTPEPTRLDLGDGIIWLERA